MCLSPSAAISPHRRAKTYTFPPNGLYLADIFVPWPTDLGWNTALFAVPPSQFSSPPSSFLLTGGRRFYELEEKCVPSPKHNQVQRARGRKWTQNQEQRRIWHFLTVFEDYFSVLIAVAYTGVIVAQPCQILRGLPLIDASFLFMLNSSARCCAPPPTSNLSNDI